MNVMLDVKENMIDEFGVKIHCGIDIASSQFFNKRYNYKNSAKMLDKKNQIIYMAEIADKFYYLEDPLDENDFDGFKELRKKTKGLIIGDDLTVTNLDRIIRATKKKSINAVIIKPNQNGSLIAVKDIVDFCRKNNIKTIFSHRSGETSENILADLAFGFQADFIKTGICGRGRDDKLNRLIDIGNGSL
jgi:enolase